MKDLLRRIQMLVGLSRVTSQSDAGQVQQLQLQNPLDTRNDTLRFAEFGFSSGLPNGTDTIVLSVGGDRSSQVVIASNHNGYRLTGLKPGEVAVYNQWGLYIKLKEDEIEVESKGKKVTINNASDVTVNANSAVNVNCATATVTSQEVTIEAPETKVKGNLTVSGTTATNGLVAGGDGSGKCTFKGDIDHEGTYALHGDYEHDGGKMTSLGRRVDGKHVHRFKDGGGQTEEPEA